MTGPGIEAMVCTFQSLLLSSLCNCESELLTNGLSVHKTRPSSLGSAKAGTDVLVVGGNALNATKVVFCKPNRCRLLKIAGQDPCTVSIRIRNDRVNMVDQSPFKLKNLFPLTGSTSANMRTGIRSGL